ncbi:xaa-Pro aminopeptidase ApepP-like, partial [Limulus polyphemus]|uniref:Xaa-Pro aminopeptidase ApepP-like n=1 Tax=Limulus polyphemus TaxID=6850 RepID=A0ABM1RWH3_LIMPO
FPQLILLINYLYVTLYRLYVQSRQVTLEVREQLRSNGCDNKNCVQILEYDDLAEDLGNLMQRVNKILVPEYVSYFIYSLIPEAKRFVRESPLISMKIVKNPTEVKGMFNAHVRIIY